MKVILKRCISNIERRNNLHHNLWVRLRRTTEKDHLPCNRRFCSMKYASINSPLPYVVCRAPVAVARWRKPWRARGSGLWRGRQRRRLCAQVPVACPSHSAPEPSQSTLGAGGHSCSRAITSPPASDDAQMQPASLQKGALAWAPPFCCTVSSHPRRRWRRG